MEAAAQNEPANRFAFFTAGIILPYDPAVRESPAVATHRTQQESRQEVNRLLLEFLNGL